MVWTRYTPPIHVAPSLNAAAREFDALYPDRSKASDGALGNASHQAERSDHNPDWSAPGTRRAIIRAIDLTTTSWGVAGQRYTAAQRAWHQALIADLIATEIANPVSRLWYVIHWIPGDPYPKIWSRTTKWAPKRYTGASPHDHHFHLSILATIAAEQDIKPWFTALHGSKPPTAPTGTVPATTGKVFMSDRINFAGELSQPLTPGENILWLGPVADDGLHPLSVLKASSQDVDLTVTVDVRAADGTPARVPTPLTWRTVAYVKGAKPTTLADEIPVYGTNQARYAGSFDGKPKAGRDARLRIVLTVPESVTGLVLKRFTVDGWTE